MAWIILVVVALAMVELTIAKNVHYIEWNRSNPIFRIDNTDHIVDINRGNLPWEYDQVNLICPKSPPGSRHPEQHVVYSVSREEYESCRITNPRPRIVAVCNRPHQPMYFTITFRSFTPTPGGFEFHPGHDYYFISTSSRSDLHRRVGGGCSTHNMRMIFKVHDNQAISQDVDTDTISNSIDDGSSSSSTTSSTTTSTPAPIPAVASVYRGRSSSSSSSGHIYYYHPRDLVELERNSVLSSASASSSGDRQRRRWRRKGRGNDNDDEEALRYTSSSSASTSSSSRECLLALLVAAASSLLLARR